MVTEQCLITEANLWKPRGLPFKLLKLTSRDITVGLLCFSGLWFPLGHLTFPCYSLCFLKGTFFSSCFQACMPLPTPRHPSEMCLFHPVPTWAPQTPENHPWSTQEVTPPASPLPTSSLPFGLCFLLSHASCTGGSTSNSKSSYKTSLRVDFVLFI